MIFFAKILISYYKFVMPKALQWAILGAYLYNISSKDIHNVAGKNLYIDSSGFVKFRQVKYLKTIVGTSVLCKILI